METAPCVQNVWESFKKRYPFLEIMEADIFSAFALLSTCFAGGGKLLLCGNGGSAADAAHITGELVKSFRLARPIPPAHKNTLLDLGMGEGPADALQEGLPVLDLTAPSALLLAILNDLGPDNVFAQQVYVYGRPGDVLWGISTSGTSQNVLQAARVAQLRGMGSLLLSGRLAQPPEGLFDVVLRAPAAECSEVQDEHSVLYHALCAMLEAERWG